MSESVPGEVLPPPALPQTFTMFAVRPDELDGIYHDIVSFEPGANAYLAIDKKGRRIVIPYEGVLAIEVVPDD